MRSQCSIMVVWTLPTYIWCQRDCLPHVRNVLVYKLLDIGQSYWVFLYSKFVYVHMWPFYREDPQQGLKRYSWGMFAHYSFLCRGGKAVFFLLPRKLPLGIKVDFVGRALHIPKGKKKKPDPWMGIVYLSTFAHFTSLNTPFKTEVPENTRGKKEAKKINEIP